MAKVKEQRLSLQECPTARSLIVVVVALVSVGMVAVHSAIASLGDPRVWYQRTEFKHTAFAAVALGIVCTLWRIDYRRLNAPKRWPWLAAILLFIAFAATALLLVPGLGHSIAGRVRWYRIPMGGASLSVQPSELLKLAMLIFLAAWLGRLGDRAGNWSVFFRAVLVIGACAGVVFDNDLSSAVLICIGGGIALLLAGARWSQLLLSVVVVGGLLAAMIIMFPGKTDRFTAIIDPYVADGNPAKFHVCQSLTSVTVGSWQGVGCGQGVRKLGFLPEDHTDFIFASFCEEWGFIGGVGILALILCWLELTRRTATRAADRFGAILAGSVGGLIGIQALMHVGVNLGVIPPTGIGLPFVSAGGTRLIVLGASAAIVISIAVRPGSGETPKAPGPLGAEPANRRPS